LTLRFDSDFVVHSEAELLLAAQVLFRCLNLDVAEQELDLVKLAAGQVTETGTWGASLFIPAASAALLTISQSTFGVMPCPQI
jgi:hypothetical protein